MEETESIFSIAGTDISERVQNAGVAGAGGAGFPSYVKWSDPDDVNYLLVNHQESEPNYYADKWLGQNRADQFATLFEYLLETVFDAIIVGTKEKYRGEWTDALEAATEANICEPDQLPVDPDDESGVTIVYTPNVYTYSEESTLLMVTAGVQIQDDLPTDHGWIVHNTESLYNISQALMHDTPVTTKYVHIDGDTPRHRCLEVPIGTTASTVLEAAGVSPDELGEDKTLVDGGPGWCYEIETPADQFGVRKRTNSILVLENDLVEENRKEDGEIDVLNERDWEETDERPHEKQPAEIDPELVRIPRITNEAYTGFVHPSEPVVSVGDQVERGEMIAEPSSEGISNPQHASISGVVSEITDTHIVLEK